MWIGLTMACSGDPPVEARPESLADAVGAMSGEGGEAFGLTLGVLGDVDGDGVVDLGAAGNAGRVCVVPGDLVGSSVAGACVVGETTADGFGASVAGRGGEWAVGAPNAGGIGTGAGAVYVFTGMAGSVADARVTVRGDAALDAFGAALAWQDLDDDGAMDLVVGAPGFDALVPDTGAAYVFFGPMTSGALSAGDAGGKLEGGLPLRHVGAPGNALAASIGFTDADGDGVPDLLLSQGGTDADSGEVDAGAAFLFLGPLVRGTLSAPGFADVSFIGTRAGEYASEPLDGGGDLTGDGLDDVVLAANGAAPERLGLFSGLREGRWSMDDADLTLEPAEAGEGTGWALGTRGDVDGDGHPDLLVGAPYGSDHAGEVRILLGPLGTGTLRLDQVPAIRSETGDELGKAIAVPGDLDHDGRDDFVIGAPLRDLGEGLVARFRGF